MKSRDQFDSDNCHVLTVREFSRIHFPLVSELLLSLLEDISNMKIPSYSRAEYLLDRETLKRRLNCEGLSFATKTLPSLMDGLLGYLETGVSDYPYFKCRQNHPVFLRGLFIPIYSQDYDEECKVMCVKCIYQLSAAFKKLKGPYEQSVLVEQLDKFVSTDESLKDSFEPEKVIDVARYIITQVMENLDPLDVDQSEDFLPRPGPGATNLPTKKHERYRPHVLYTQLTDAFNFVEWYAPSNLNYRGYTATLIGTDENYGIDKLKIQNVVTSRFKFVHKTFGKPRCICIEQLETQWLQQALRRALCKRIESHPLTSGYVNFTSQAINSNLALINSTTREYATLDMSEASDRISRGLVQELFRDTVILRYLLAVSTPVIEMPKDVPYSRKYLHAKKFAPMGSAVCFPVMALVHFALIKAICSKRVSHHVNDIPVWVYGDDIVVASNLANIVMEELPNYGMKINRNKSFSKSYFRESCGMDAYNGINVTPIRFKNLISNSWSVNTLVANLENEGNLFEKGYLLTAACLRSHILSFSKLGSKLPVVKKGAGALGFIRDQHFASTRSSHYWLKRRWNVKLQEYEFKGLQCFCRLDETPPLNEYEHYLREQVVQSQDDVLLREQVYNPELHKTINESTSPLILRRKWLPGSAYRNW